MKPEFSQQILDKCSTTKCHEIGRVEDEVFHARGRSDRWAGGEAGRQAGRDMKLTAAFGNSANAPKNHHPSVSFLYVSVNDKLQWGLSVSGSVHTPVF